MKAFVVRCEYEDGDSFEWPRFVVLGKRADVLADRMIEYAESIFQAECTPQSVAIEVRTFDVQNWLAMQESTEWVNEFFVAIAGALDGEEYCLLERAMALSGQHCIIVADAHTPLQPGWQSVIRLPSHRSWDAQWAWGIRVVLDVLLEAVLHRGLICIDDSYIRACLVGRYSVLAVARAEGEKRADVAVEKAFQSLSGRADLATAEAFILAFHAGPGIRMKEIHQGLESLSEKAEGLKKLWEEVDWRETFIVVTYVPTDDNRFAVSLIASLPFERSQ